VSEATAETTGDDPFATLLEVQDLDTQMAQLLHRKQTLPERRQLAAAEAKLLELAEVSAQVNGERQALQERQTALEEHVRALVERRHSIEGRMYAARGAPPRDLQAMEAEIQGLSSRQSGVEDEQLTVMEEQEPLDAQLVSLVSDRAELDEAVASLRAAVAAAEVSVNAELSTLALRRQVAAGKLPPDLAVQYEELRERLDGVGAARLVGNRCTGCHLELPAVELDRIRHLPKGSVVTCDQCGRILVP